MHLLTTVFVALSSTALARPLYHQRRAALDTGSCGSPEIEFAVGLDGRKEGSFQAVNQQDFDHGSALNIGVITNFVCGQLQNKCKASAATVATCNQAAQAASQVTGGAAADAFNAALGINTNFATVVARSDARVQPLDLGSCGSPEIQFADGLDGRTEPSFQAINQEDFNHGSALNIGVIANFICNQLSSSCDASEEAIDACFQATIAAVQASGGAAADAFNQAFGISSNFATVIARDITVEEARRAAADNLQSFSGTLGASPPAVNAFGNGEFQVDGNAAFNNLQNALVRDVQHNQCANAANASGNTGDLNVAACQTQQDQCNALAKSSA